MQDPSLDLILRRLDRLSDEFYELRDGVHRAVRIANDDPEMALTRARKVLEYVVRDIYQRRCAEEPGTRPLENLLQRLVKDGHIPKKLGAHANHIRELGNVGTHAHGEKVTLADVRRSLEDLTMILEWYFEAERPDAMRGERETPTSGEGGSPVVNVEGGESKGSFGGDEAARKRSRWVASFPPGTAGDVAIGAVYGTALGAVSTAVFWPAAGMNSVFNGFLGGVGIGAVNGVLISLALILARKILAGGVVVRVAAPFIGAGVAELLWSTSAAVERAVNGSGYLSRGLSRLAYFYSYRTLGALLFALFLGAALGLILGEIYRLRNSRARAFKW